MKIRYLTLCMILTACSPHTFDYTTLYAIPVGDKIGYSFKGSYLGHNLESTRRAADDVARDVCVGKMPRYVHWQAGPDRRAGAALLWTSYEAIVVCDDPAAAPT